MSEMTDFIVTILVILGIFLMSYMTWRQQGLIETFREFKEMFEEKWETTKDAMQVYK